MPAAARQGGLLDRSQAARSQVLVQRMQCLPRNGRYSVFCALAVHLHHPALGLHAQVVHGGTEQFCRAQTDGFDESQNEADARPGRRGRLRAHKAQHLAHGRFAQLLGVQHLVVAVVARGLVDQHLRVGC